uniref:Uncharacterized protein n=1 Tax=Panagrolaimus davidi TaxID=227884 RepID=A0A914P9K3_9BILA
MQAPHLLELYLLESNGAIFHQPFNILAQPMIKIHARLYFLTFLLRQNPFTENEFPVFMYYCLCKLEFPTLPIQEQLRIKNIQFQCEQQFTPKIVVGDRLLELSVLAQNFFNVFKAYL